MNNFRTRGSQAAARVPHDQPVARESSVLSHPGPIRVAIAMLLDSEMGAMARRDLVDLIHMSSLPFLSQDVCRRLEFLNDESLSRLGFLVRRCCRNQLDAHRRHRGERMLWREAI
jgi:hypothetical protein